MHVACSLAATRRLLPALTRLRAAIEVKADVWPNLVKIGRTHLQDATPLTLGQEFSGYANQLYRAGRRIEPAVVNGPNRLPPGGTAFGTAHTAPPCFSGEFCAAQSGRPPIST